MDAFKNRRWLVIPATEVENINFDQVQQSGPESLAYSVDGSQTFVKYDVNVIEEDQVISFTNPETQEEITHTIPAGVYGRPSIYKEGMTEYNHEEILALLSTEAWTEPLENKDLA